MDKYDFTCIGRTQGNFSAHGLRHNHGDVKICNHWTGYYVETIYIEESNGSVYPEPLAKCLWFAESHEISKEDRRVAWSTSSDYWDYFRDIILKDKEAIADVQRRIDRRNAA